MTETASPTAVIDTNDDGTFEASLGLIKGNVRGTIPEEAKLEIQQIRQFFFFTVTMRITVAINNDGRLEIVIEDKDTNLDGEADKILLDSDSDGKPDLKFL